MRSAAVRLALLAAFVSPAGAAAQEPTPPSVAPPLVFPVALDMVNVTVTVYDRDGNIVTDLEREDFELFEDGRPQPIELFGRAGDPEGRGEDDVGAERTLALDVGLLMDTSGSMLNVLKLSQTAAVRFLGAIPRAHDLLTIFFDQDIRVSHYDSEQQQGLYARINALEGGGRTALYDAIAVYLSRIEPGPGRKVLVLFSDGDDSISEVTYPELLSMVRSSPVTVYAIAVRDPSQRNRRSIEGTLVLRKLADISGGRVFSPISARELGGIYDTILEELGGQYVLGFVSDNLRPDGKFRKLKVGVKRHGLKCRHRDGYYAAPAASPP